MTTRQPRKNPAPAAALVEITPEMAKQWLAEHNTRNRNLSHTTIAAYARDMTAGRWKNAGETIKFAADGTLLDGQHRLAAIARANVTIPTYVVRNLDHDAQDVMDSGRKRSAADALTIDGVKYAGRLAAAARIALSRDNGGTAKSSNFTNAEVQAYIRNAPDLADAVELLGHLTHRVPLPPSVSDYCFWLLYRVDAESAYVFYDQFASGAGLDEGSPILALRRRLAGDYGVNRRTSHDERISLVMRAWNYWRRGKSVRKLQTTSRAGQIDIPEPK